MSRSGRGLCLDAVVPVACDDDALVDEFYPGEDGGKEEQAKGEDEELAGCAGKFEI